MSRIVPLDAARHHAVCVDTMAGAAARQFVQIGLSEIALAAADMPLLLVKDGQTGRFNLVALFGLIEQRNLFWQQGGMQSTYLPRAASLTAFRINPEGLEGIGLDEADPALSLRGEPLFAADGSATPFLTSIRNALCAVIADVAAAQALIDAYAQLRVIRPLSLVLRHADGHEHAITGLYGLDEEQLAALDDATVVALHRADRLAPAAVMTASLAQVERLKQLHNAAQLRPIASFQLTFSA